MSKLGLRLLFVFLEYTKSGYRIILHTELDPGRGREQIFSTRHVVT